MFDVEAIGLIGLRAFVLEFVVIKSRQDRPCISIRISIILEEREVIPMALGPDP